MAKRVKGITIEIGGDTSGLNKALKITNDSTKKLQGELKQVNTALKFDPKNIDLVNQKTTLLSQAIGDTKDKVTALKKAKDKADADMAKGTEISATQYRKLEREISFAESSLKGLENQAKKSKIDVDKVADSFTNVGGKVTNAGNALMPLSGIALGVGTASVVMAQQFTDSMAKVSTIADVTKVPLSALESEILTLSDQTGVSANLIAEDVYNAISAGQDTADAVNFVTKSSKLAKAGFAETAQSLDILTTILNAYGLESSETTNISDMLIQTQNKGKTTVGQLSESMGKIIPTAKGQNVALDQLCVSYATMTAKGIATTETTTYLNSMINELGKSGTISADILKDETGKSFSQLMGEGESLAEVLVILDENAKENGESMGDMFGSAEASKAALTLLDGGVDEFNQNLIEMNDTAGATEEAFEKMQTPAEELRISLNKFKNVGIKLGNALEPVFDELSDVVDKLADKVSSLSDKQMEAVATTLLVVAGIAPLVIIGGKIITGIGAITKLTKTLFTLVSAHPIGALITALGLVVGGMILYAESTSDTSSEIDELCEKNDELIKKSQDLQAEIDKEIDAREDNREEIDNQMGASKLLADELYKLAEKEKLTNGEKTIMAGLVQELNDTIPTLNLLLDEETGILNLQRAEVDKSIDSQEKLLKVKAAQEDLIDIAKRQYDVEKKQAAQLNENNETIAKRTELQKEYNELYDKMSNQTVAVRTNEDRDRLKSLKKDIADLNTQVVTNGDAFLANKDQLHELGLEYDTASGYISENATAMEENKTATDKATGVTALLEEKQRMMSGNAPVTGEALNNLNKRIEEYELATDNATVATAESMYANQDLTPIVEATGLEYDKVSEKIQHYADMTQNAFSTIEPTIKLTAGEMTKNLETNTKTVEKWSDNLVTLSDEGIDKGLLQCLRDAGPEAATTVQNLVNASDTEIQKLNTAFKNGGETAIKTLMDELGVESVTNSGKKVSEDIGAGIASSTAPVDEVQGQVVKVESATYEAIEDSDFQGAGIKITDEIAEGIILGAPTVLSAVASLLQRAELAKNGTSTHISSSGKVHGGGGTSFALPKLKAEMPKLNFGIPMLANGGTLLSGSAIVGEAGPELLQILNGRTVVKPLSNSEKMNPLQMQQQRNSANSNREILQALNVLTQAVNKGHVLQADGYTIAKVVREANASNNRMLGVQ